MPIVRDSQKNDSVVPPKEKYSFAAEIYEHSQRIGKHYGLYERTWFQTRVRSVDWDESIKRWRISSNRNDDIKARFVIMALGPASRPQNATRRVADGLA